MYHDIAYDIVHNVVYEIYDIVQDNVYIVYDIVYDIDKHIRYFSDFSTQVEMLVRILKHKLRPDDAYFKTKDI
jgi:hypothetical protein